MGKHKNRQKGPAQQPQSSYHHFLKEMQYAVSFVGGEKNLLLMDQSCKQKMFKYYMRINNPIAGNEHVTAKELKLIAEKTKRYYRLPNFDLEGKKISVYHVHLIYCFLTIRAELIEKGKGNENDNDLVVVKNVASKLFDAFLTRYIVDNFKVLTQLSTPDHRYFGMNIRPAAIFKENPSLELITEIYGVLPNKCIMDINGYNRPAFRLGKPSATIPVEWIAVDALLLKNFYKGTLSTLDVYIQSHALSRLRERLDIFDSEALNYVLWENTNDINYFEVYKGYLLLPFKVFGIKIGYLAASIVDEKLLFRTFLFITHTCTPEGDRLKKLTGLDKEDISYWRIDRLSTFLALNEDKHSGLINFFCGAGLKDLMRLKNMELTIDSMQIAALDKLEEYIRRGNLLKQMQEHPI